MQSRDIRHMCELAFVKSLRNLVCGLAPGRLKNRLDKIWGLVDDEFDKRGWDKQFLDRNGYIIEVGRVLDEFGAKTGWYQKELHPGTAICFCLGILEASDIHVSHKLFDSLNDAAEYFDRAGNLPGGSMWGGDLAAHKWREIFGDEFDSGPDSQTRMEDAGGIVDRENMMDDYKEIFYG